MNGGFGEEGALIYFVALFAVFVLVVSLCLWGVVEFLRWIF